jgi:hypothetical protein
VNAAQIPALALELCGDRPGIGRAQPRWAPVWRFFILPAAAAGQCHTTGAQPA